MGKQKERVGIIVSDVMDKTVVVTVERQFPHSKYPKIIKKTKKFKAHDEKNIGQKGDKVRIVECRPLSKTKRWKLVEILEKAKAL